MILTPEVRALLKRMDADDAIDKAVEMALEAAANVCERRADEHLYGPFWNSARGAECDACASAIRALKASK